MKDKEKSIYNKKSECYTLVLNEDSIDNVFGGLNMKKEFKTKNSIRFLGKTFTIMFSIAFISFFIFYILQFLLSGMYY